MINIKATADITEALQMLQVLEAGIKDLRPALEECKDHMIESIYHNFDVSGRPKWEPYSPGTRVRDRGKLLVKSGDLERSIEGHVVSNTLFLKSDWPYAKYHQHGTVNMPARPFIIYQLEDVDFIMKTIREYIRKMSYIQLPGSGRMAGGKSVGKVIWTPINQYW